jgi:hypothetical protein
MIRFLGAGAPPRVAPRGMAWGDAADAVAVQVASETSMDALPEASSLSPGTRVFVLPEPARARGIFSALMQARLTRRARSEALLVRGYVDIGAELDAASRLDLVFGCVPAPG